MDKSLVDIGMNSINLVINMESDGEESWVISVGEVWKTQSVDQ